MGENGVIDVVRGINPVWTVLVAILSILLSLMAAVFRSILAGGLVPRSSHEEAIAIYKEAAIKAEAREQWWRDQAYSENHMAGRSLDLAADLATRRAIIQSVRGADQGDNNA